MGELDTLDLKLDHIASLKIHLKIIFHKELGFGGESNLQAAKCKLQAASCKLHAASCKLKSDMPS